jgi:hypothetical protein
MERRLAVPVAGSMWAILMVSLWAPPASAVVPKWTASPGVLSARESSPMMRMLKGLTGDDDAAQLGQFAVLI